MNIEQLVQHADRLVCNPADVAKLRQLILTLAVQGKLFESHLVKELNRLGDVIKLISGQHLLAEEQNADKKGIPYLTGPSDFGKDVPVISRWTNNPKSIAEPGDVLLSVKGSVGKVNELPFTAAIGRQIMAIRANSRTTSKFIVLCLRNAEPYFQKLSRGIAIPGISREDVMNLPITLPPLAEQERIVARVDELMGWCDRLEEQLRMREELRQLWLSTSASREQLAADLQAWCQRAEASGISALQQFSQQLRAARA